jgi:hypothetical protein
MKELVFDVVSISYPLHDARLLPTTPAFTLVNNYHDGLITRFAWYCTVTEKQVLLMNASLS